jgi:hypothetical protein
MQEKNKYVVVKNGQRITKAFENKEEAEKFALQYRSLVENKSVSEDAIKVVTQIND